MARKEFDDWGGAFDYCRETGHPVVVTVKGEGWKIYPSGKAVEVMTQSTSSGWRLEWVSHSDYGREKGTDLH